MMKSVHLQSLSTKLKAEKCRRSFYQFFLEFWNTIETEDLVDNWHIKYLCDELQQAAELVFSRKPKEEDLIINVPPGTSKSSISTVMLPVWCWTRDESIRLISSSYSNSLSIAHSVKSRDLILSDKFKDYYPSIQLKKDQSGKSEYKNTSHGERISTSTRGTVTGKHAHIIIIDDPLNPKEAASEIELKNANVYLDQTLNSRKVDKRVTLTILIMQRLHADDTTGHLLKKGKKIKHICLPGELSDNISPVELKDNYVDGLLDPIRMDRGVLGELKQDLGSYGYSGQIMQKLSPEGGGIWKEWFIPVPDKDFNKLIDKLENYGTDWDLAYTEKESNSASAYSTMGKINKDIYIDAVGYKFLEFPELINYMKTKVAPHYIEQKASGKSAKQTLRKKGIPAIEVPVTGGDKIARTRMATPYAEGGLVYVRESIIDMIYNDDKQGILNFPNNSHDDLADCIAQGIQRLTRKNKLQVMSF